MKSICLMLICLFLAESGQDIDNPEEIPYKGNFAKEFTLGKPKEYKNLKIFPVYADFKKLDFVFMNKAIEKKQIQIEEVSSGGSVNTLKLSKQITKDQIFIMSGEIVQGAKQDRVIAYDLIFGGKDGSYSTNAYCVEHGRWTYKSQQFSDAKMVGASNIRQFASKSASPTGSNQDAIWNEVSMKNKDLGSSNESDAYKESYSSKKFKESSEEYLKVFASMPKDDKRMIGMIVFIDDKGLVIDIFNSNNMLINYYDKLLNSYIQDAIHPSALANNKEIKDPKEFLNALNGESSKQVKLPGIGRVYTLENSSISGFVTFLNSDFVHASIFARKDTKNESNRMNNNERQINIPSNNQQNQQYSPEQD